MATSKNGKEENYMRRRYTYIDGNTVRKLEVAEEEYELPREEEKDRRRRHQEQRERQGRSLRARAHRMNMMYVIALATIVGIAAFVSVKYLQAQAQVTTMQKEISDLESQIAEMKEEYKTSKDELTNDIDLDYIYKYATEKLGMKHPSKKQVINYKSTESDSVTQYGDIPSSN